MASTDIDVKYVAHLARLKLSGEEEAKFGSQLGQILGYIAKLNELDVSQVEPTAHAVLARKGADMSGGKNSPTNRRIERTESAVNRPLRSSFK